MSSLVVVLMTVVSAAGALLVMAGIEQAERVFWAGHDAGAVACPLCAGDCGA